MTVLAIRVPAENEREPDHTEQVLDALHARMERRDIVTLSLARHRGLSSLFVHCPEHLTSVVGNGLQAFYPDAEIEPLDESSLTPDGNSAATASRTPGNACCPAGNAASTGSPRCPTAARAWSARCSAAACAGNTRRLAAAGSAG